MENGPITQKGIVIYACRVTFVASKLRCLLFIKMRLRRLRHIHIALYFFNYCTIIRENGRCNLNCSQFECCRLLYCLPLTISR